MSRHSTLMLQLTQFFRATLLARQNKPSLHCVHSWMGQMWNQSALPTLPQILPRPQARFRSVPTGGHGCFTPWRLTHSAYFATLQLRRWRGTDGDATRAIKAPEIDTMFPLCFRSVSQQMRRRSPRCAHATRIAKIAPGEAEAGTFRAV